MLIKERNTSYMLWFDVEKRYKTIQWGTFWEELWFDVEKDIRQLASSAI